jgi:hypothetical protein
MTLDLHLSSDTEAKIRQCAAASGQDVESFVLQAVTEKLSDAEPRPGVDSASAEWADTIRQLTNLHPVVTHFVDDSRDSIYAGRGQ